MNVPSHKKGAEAEEICQLGEESVPSESGQRLITDETREEIEDTLITETARPAAVESPVFTPIEAATRVSQVTLSHQRTELKRQLECDPLIMQVCVLLQQNTLEAHEEAYRLLHQKNVLATQQYDIVHRKREKNFSEVSPDRVNDLARYVLRHPQIKLDKNSLILELGSGVGNTTLYLGRNSKAGVQGVDKSEFAIAEAQRILRKTDKEGNLAWIEDSLRAIAERHGRSFEEIQQILLAMKRCNMRSVKRSKKIEPKEYRAEIAEAVKLMNTAGERVSYPCHDYLEVLKASRGMGIDVIIADSTVHYYPHLVLQEQIFPMIAEALINKKTGQRGMLCLAMKIASSASAQSDDQFRLVKDHPYNPSIEVPHNIFRIYPADLEEVLALVKLYFDIVEVGVKPRQDYDKTGDTEMMCEGFYIPKAA